MLTLRFAFTSEQILTGLFGRREREEKLVPKSGCFCHLANFLITSLQIAWWICCKFLNSCRDDSPQQQLLVTVTATVRSRPDFCPGGSYWYRPCAVLCDCSKSNASPPSEHWDSMLPPCPPSPPLHSTDTPLQPTPQCLQVLRRMKACMRSIRRAGYEPLVFPIFSLASGEISSSHTAISPCQPTGFAVWPAQPSPIWRSHCGAELRLYCKD